MLEEKNLPAPSQKLSPLKSIKVLILSDSALQLAAITASFKSASIEIDWLQAANKAKYEDYLNQTRMYSRFASKRELSAYNELNAPLSLILWDGDFKQITLNEAIAQISIRNLNIPLLVINGKPHTSTAVAAIKAGAIDYITADRIEQLPEVILLALSESDRNCQLLERKTESERQLEKLITENPDGIIVVDEKGIVKFINLAALELLGQSRENLIGESLGFPVVNGDYLEVDIPRSPTEILVAQMRVSAIQWQGAKAFVVSLRDITQQKQAEEERIKLLEEAQAANRAKDEFLAVLSHELRTPLNPIVGWSQLLAMGNLSESQIKRGAEIIQRNAMLQTQLIEDILDVSRIIRGKLELQPSAIDLATVIKNALDTVALAAEAKSIKIETDLDENIGLVQGDPTRIQQVVWNLLSNAVKFSPHNGKIKIVLTSTDAIAAQKSAAINELPLRYAQIQVIDFGKGIKPEFLPYVFDYFRQAEGTKSRSEGGLGLGLAIVRRIVELHGGEVTANSSGLGKGATFTVFLPIANSLDKFNCCYNEYKP